MIAMVNPTPVLQLKEVLAQHEALWRKHRCHVWFYNTMVWMAPVVIGSLAWYVKLPTAMWLSGVMALVFCIVGNIQIVRAYRLFWRSQARLIDSFDETHAHLVRSIDEMARAIKKPAP